MKKILNAQQTQLVIDNLHCVKNFSTIHDIEEGSEEECELHYRLIHAATSYDEEKGSFTDYAYRGFADGLKTFKRKRDRFYSIHIPLSVTKGIEALSPAKSSCVETKKVKDLLDVADITGQDRHIVNLYYRQQRTKGEIAETLSLSRYKLNKRLDAIKQKIAAWVKEKGILFSDFLDEA